MIGQEPKAFRPCYSIQTALIPRFIHRSRVTFITLLFVLAAAHPSNVAQEIQSSVNPSPAAREDLSLIGYFSPPRMDRLLENQPAATLVFADATHVLLTFNQKQVWNRLPECLPKHQ